MQKIKTFCLLDRVSDSLNTRNEINIRNHETMNKNILIWDVNRSLLIKAGIKYKYYDITFKNVVCYYNEYIKETNKNPLFNFDDIIIDEINNSLINLEIILTAEIL